MTFLFPEDTARVKRLAQAIFNAPMQDEKDRAQSITFERGTHNVIIWHVAHGRIRSFRTLQPFQAI